MTELRIALCGSSGTGKTTLATYLAATLNLPFNPVGSRSVSKAMGFDSPYDVDKAGKRAEFQRRLVLEKRSWEKDHPSFVSDRTTVDNLAYTMLHDVKTIDQDLLAQIVSGMERYTHIFYCPVDVFCQVGDDSARVKDPTYQKLYDIVLKGLVDTYRKPATKFITITVNGIEERRTWVQAAFQT